MTLKEKQPDYTKKALAWLEKQNEKPQRMIFAEAKEALYNTITDERLRKTTIAFLKVFAEQGYENAVECIDWLKNQGERKQNVTDIISYLENYFATTTEEQQEKDWDEFKNWVEKHFNHDRDIEINPTNKVESKFKVGDWIINSEGTLRYIVTVDKTGYETNKGWLTRDYYEKRFHLWTIKDAKDGDVLAVDWYEHNDSWEQIIIFKKYHHNGVKGLLSSPCVEGYGNTFKNGKLVLSKEVPYYSKTWTAYLHPATKEQRDLLFSKMKEAGYEWDSEKKKLMKIEQNPTWSKDDERYAEGSVE